MKTYTKTTVSTEPKSVEFDYIASPTALTLSDSPTFPERFHDMIYHAMCVEDEIIQQSEKV